jgi:hypothetical protein
VADFKQVCVDPRDDGARLMITFADNTTVAIPMSDQVALVLNAGGWMMREYAARLFESQSKGESRIAGVIRQIPVGGVKASSQAPAPAALQKASG